MAAQASPITYAKNLYAPLLMLQGEKDVVCPFDQIPPFVAAAQSASNKDVSQTTDTNPAVTAASVTSVFYPEDGHGMREIKTQQERMGKLSSFFRLHLKPWGFREPLPKP